MNIPNMSIDDLNQYCLTCMKFADLNQYCLTCSEMLCTDCIKNHLSQNCHTCSLRTMKLTCTEVFQNLSTRIRLELEKHQKERQNVEETDVKLKKWMERAKASLQELKNVFVDHLDKAFQDCEDAISKQASSVEIMKEVYEGRMLKGQMLLDGIKADFNAPQNLAKAYRDSASYTHKVDAFLQQKPVLPVFDEIGCLKFAFGVSGSYPGQMLYPNCIASCPVTGNFVCDDHCFDNYSKIFNKS
uniref:B box-type domain-containing protein n=1 Tax=Panagrolaimus davidi TaxID=227884 RepID=A0A914PJJ4_9BILA